MRPSLPPCVTFRTRRPALLLRVALLLSLGATAARGDNIAVFRWFEVEMRDPQDSTGAELRDLARALCPTPQLGLNGAASIWVLSGDVLDSKDFWSSALAQCTGFNAGGFLHNLISQQLEPLVAVPDPERFYYHYFFPPGAAIGGP